ncbi:hypothetical protein Dsin_006929 [Dipteronia sinensis]|uniref:MADS-box domain-containing protein n=1 Tax=Dipteronia sinensis TaxID=43782 RepID=A0AAE0B0I1_9ROSI|nr:hypothetical protein Dsin_006929 [Dipteronia sinensis]
MARRKIKQELISNESKRKVTFRKRKGGMLKKMNEITTLCGVIGCAIIYSTFDNRPEIWPSPPELTRVIDRFKETPEEERDKYTVDQKTFLGRYISRSSNALERERKKNQGLAMELTLIDCLAGKSLHDLKCLEDPKELEVLLEEKIKCFTDKIETMGLKSKQVNYENDIKK